MKVKVFIDGSSGTTGLRIADRLAARPEIELLSISAEGRKDVHERAKVINSADLAFLCLPDAASKEVMPLLRPDVKVLDTSTAFRTDAAWDYGFPELKGQKEKIQNSYRVAVPGCYASGFISIARPLVELGLVPQSYSFSCTGISGYSGSGAGKLPTASAVVSDIVEIAGHMEDNIPTGWTDEKQPVAPMGEVTFSYFLRLAGKSADKLADVRAAFGEAETIELPEMDEFAVVTGEMTEARFRKLAAAFEEDIRQTIRYTK